MNPRKIEQVMKQMGIDVTRLNAEEVVIKTGDDELVFNDAQVAHMGAQGQETYQIVSEPEARELGADDDGDGSIESAGSAEAAGTVPADGVAIVAQRAGVPEDEARKTLEIEDDDLAAAIA